MKVLELHFHNIPPPTMEVIFFPCLEITSPQVSGMGKSSVSGETTHLSNFQNTFTPTNKRAGLESQTERQNPVQSSLLAKLRMESPFIKHRTPVGFHSLSCLIRDSRNSNGVFRRQALARLSEIYRHTEIPDSANALCTTDTACALLFCLPRSLGNDQ